MKALAKPCGRVILLSKTLTVVFWQKSLSKSYNNYLNTTSGNEFTEKNVAANDPKGLTCVAIQEIYSDDEVDNLGMHKSFTSFSKTMSFN